MNFFDYKPVISSLLSHLRQEGFTPQLFDDGAGEIAATGLPESELVAALTAVDECHLLLAHPKRESLVWVFLVYGNSAAETVCDHSSLSGELGAALDRAFEAHAAAWEGKPVPYSEA